MNKLDIEWSEFLTDSEVVAIPIYDLIPNPKNPRTIKDYKFQKLLRDIDRDTTFLIQRPILANSVDGTLTIYAGHQRWAACKELGYETVPVTIAHNLSPKVMAHRMILDNIHFGVWDSEKLQDYSEEALDMFGLDVDLESFDMGLNKEKLLAPKHDRGELGEDVSHGKHVFSLIFDSVEAKEEFEIIALNMEEGVRFEDWLISKINSLNPDE